MENIKAFFENQWTIRAINSIIIIIVSIVLYKLIFHLIEKSEEKNKLNLFTGKKSKTYLNLIKNLIRYIFVIITILIILQTNGVNVSSLLAGVGILGAVLGLAVQDWLKDIIRGSSILSDNYFSVGDIVKYNDIEAKVLIIGLKTTKIQDLKTNNIISIANRNIEQIEIVSEFIYINVPMPYETKLDKAEKTITNITEAIKKNNNVEDCKYKGVNDLSDSSIKYLIEIKCNPINKLQVRRDGLRSILDEMSKAGIDVPYTQIDIHEK